MKRQGKSPYQRRAECLNLQRLVNQLRLENAQRALQPVRVGVLEDDLSALKKTAILSELNNRLRHYELET